MKKSITALACAIFMIVTVNAQDLVSKKGIPILPEKGEFGLSIDAVPFFVYAGNLFHGNNVSGGPAWAFPNSMLTIQGKYFLSPKEAIRGRIRIGYNTITEKNLVVDQTKLRAIKYLPGSNLNPMNYKSPNIKFPLATIEDKKGISSFDLILGAGLEKRRGKGRVQGVYGAMVNIQMGSGGQTNKYANQMDTGYYYVVYAGLTPDTNLRSFQRGAISSYGSTFNNSGWTTSRTTELSEGFAFGVGANIFVGVEYFIAPKISIGGEFSFGLMYMTTGKSTEKIEEVRTYTTATSIFHRIESYEQKMAGSSSFGIDNDNSYGAINLSFYF